MKAPECYEIRVEDHLGTSWSTWFQGLAVRHEENGTTTLCGALDQAALHGVLMKIRDLGLPLVSVQRKEQTLDKDQNRGG